MLIKKILTLIDGERNFSKSKDVLHIIKRVYTDELILIEDNEVLELHSPILEGTSRVKIEGTGRLTV